MGKFRGGRLQRLAMIGACLFSSLMIFTPVQALSLYDLNTWQTTSALPEAMHDATTATYNGYAYQLGGLGISGSRSQVYYAPFNDDGTVGDWTATTSLPNAVYDSATVTHNGYIYEIGGNPNGGSGSSDVVYYAPLNPDGSVGTWNTTSSLPKTLTSHTAVVNNGYVYALGGYSHSTGLSTSVYYAPLNPDGTLGSWTATGSLPDFSNNGTAVVANGYVYQMGGLGNGFAVTPTVYYAPISVNGSVSSWTTTTSLPDPSVSASAVVSNDRIYHIGGQDDPSWGHTADVHYTTLNPNGTLGAWETTTNALPEPLSESGAIAYNDYIYTFGGSNSGSYIDTVYYSKVATPVTTVDLSNAANSAAATIETASGTNITCSSAVTEASLAMQDAGYTYPLGLVNFCFDTDVTDNQVTITFVTTLLPSQVVARHYNPTTNTYSTIPGAVIASATHNGQPALRLTYTLADNGPLDSNAAVGSITDPVGLAMVDAQVPLAPNAGVGPAEPALSPVLLLLWLAVASGFLCAIARRGVYAEK